MTRYIIHKNTAGVCHAAC